MNIKEEKPRTELKSQKNHKRSLSLFHCISYFARELLSQRSITDIPKPEERLSADLPRRLTVGPDHIIEVH
jgi:hypothetical protein